MSDKKKQRVMFRLEAPGAREVCLAGDFNDWNPAARPLRGGKGASWSTRVALPPGRYEYRFVVDGAWISDPAAPEAAPNPFGTENSVLRI